MNLKIYRENFIGLPGGGSVIGYRVHFIFKMQDLEGKDHMVDIQAFAISNECPIKAWTLRVAASLSNRVSCIDIGSKKEIVGTNQWMTTKLRKSQKILVKWLVAKANYSTLLDNNSRENLEKLALGKLRVDGEPLLK